MKYLTLNIKNKFLYFMLLVFVWQVALAILGYFIERHLGCPDIPSYTHPVSFSFLSHMDRFDSEYYKAILQGGYEWLPISRVFYPLYCVVIKICQIITFGLLGLYETAFLANTVCTTIAVYSLYKIIDSYVKDEASVVSGFIVLTFPTAVFFHFLYTESLFCAIAFYSFYMALKEKWLYCCILLGMLTSVRLPAVLFIALCGLQYLDSCHWNLKKILKKELFIFLITPFGFISFACYLYFVCGDYLAMFQSYKYGWSYHVFDINIFKVYYHTFFKVLNNTANKANETAPFLLVVFCLISSIYFMKNNSHLAKKTYPLGIFGLLSIVMFSLNSNLVSVSRYLLPCVNIYIFIYIMLNGKMIFRLLAILLMIVSSVFAFFFFKKFCMWLWIA